MIREADGLLSRRQGPTDAWSRGGQEADTLHTDEQRKCPKCAGTDLTTLRTRYTYRPGTDGDGGPGQYVPERVTEKLQCASCHYQWNDTMPL